MASEQKDLLDAIEKVATTFQEFQKINDTALAAVEQKNEARATELNATLEKISADLTEQVQQRTIAEKRWKTATERIEVLEALNDRPRMSVQDRAKSEVKDAFLKCLRSKFEDLEARQEYKAAMAKAVEVKAVTIGTVGDGGYAVPEEIGRAIEKLLLAMSDIVPQVKMVTAGTSDYKELVTIHGTTSAWATETGTRNETGTANLRERAPTWGELYSYPKASNWALEDIFFDVAGWLTEDAAEGQAKALDAAIYNGNGTGKPTGIFAAAPTAVADHNSPLRAGGVIEFLASVASPQAITADRIIDLTYKLNPRYRTNARFAMNTVTQGFVRKMKDSYGQYLWQPSLQAGQPDLLLGRPVSTWEDLADPTTADGYPVVFGDFRRAYLLVARTGLAIDREAFTTPGYTKFYVRKRWGGVVLNNDAIKCLKLAD